MIYSYLIGKEEKSLNNLQEDLTSYCPQLKVKGVSKALCELELSENVSQVVFWVANGSGFPSPDDDSLHRLLDLKSVFLICLGSQKDQAYHAMKLSAIDFLLQPYCPADLIRAVHRVENLIRSRPGAGREESGEAGIIGIPTVEGCEFLPIRDIIKCEGLQSYTRIVSRDRPDLICSNNIGELRKRLEPFGFFAPHKSYIINFREIEKYSKDGIIFMKDGSRKDHALVKAADRPGGLATIR